MTEDFNPRRAAPKNTKKWCKGKVGREHKTEIMLRPNRVGLSHPCRPNPEWAHEYNWSIGCHHAEICTECGKQIRPTLKPGECPDLKETA